MNDKLSVVQVSTTDTHGGAALVSFNLHRTYVERGLASCMLVGKRLSDDPNVIEIQLAKRDVGISWITWQSARAQHYAGKMLGRECFVQPGFWRMLDRMGPPPQIVHCHNLLDGYFDLRALPTLCQRFHVFLTLHDMWLLTGHCAHPLGCERWKAGCGNCPDLSIYPAIRRDATRHNWRCKRRIYGQSRLHVAAPARWLLDRVKESMLVSGAVDYRVIPYGIDLNVFQPGDRAMARAELGLSGNAYLILFVAAGIKRNPFKDIDTLRAAIALIGERAPGKEVVGLAVGEASAPETLGRAQLHFAGPQDQADLVRYYQAADVYLHAARADTFPNTVLEALACGVPVVASDVGGIGEQVIEGETGRLVPAGDAHAMAAAVLPYLENKELQNATGEMGACDARSRFSLKRQADEYIAWYRDAISTQPLAWARTRGA
jgi:glycosyltransferase involved in cell wall biosynthesis